MISRVCREPLIALNSSFNYTINCIPFLHFSQRCDTYIYHGRSWSVLTSFKIFSPRRRHTPWFEYLSEFFVWRIIGYHVCYFFIWVFHFLLRSRMKTNAFSGLHSGDCLYRSLGAANRLSGGASSLFISFKEFIVTHAHSSEPWSSRQLFLLKRRYPPTTLHAVISQKRMVWTKYITFFFFFEASIRG